MSPEEEVRPEEEPTAKWPVVSIRGGPHGRKVDTKVGGETVPNIHRTEIVIDVNDAIRVTNYQFLAVDFEAEVVGGAQKGWIVKVSQVDHSGEHPKLMEVATGKGATRRQALMNAASQLPYKENE